MADADVPAAPDMVEVDLGDGRTVRVRADEEDAFRESAGVPKTGKSKTSKTPAGDDAAGDSDEPSGKTAANKRRSTR